ncbi:MAG: hypothetical protein O2960_00765 [Verrucomicrobia bacterium]|nr:hypothetical protein [Verrucomicrobiota bacterium]
MLDDGVGEVSPAIAWESTMELAAMLGPHGVIGDGCRVDPDATI